MDVPGNLDLVNWIINQGFFGSASPSGGTYSMGDIQKGIWVLIDDGDFGVPGPWSPVHVQEIVDAALASGEGFVPGCGEGPVVPLHDRRRIEQGTSKHRVNRSLRWAPGSVPGPIRVRWSHKLRPAHIPKTLCPQPVCPSHIHAPDLATGSHLCSANGQAIGSPYQSVFRCQ